jgi:calcineurin-like phosphoesterase family protein
VSLTFIHLSDVHFGQENGGRVVVHNDVRERLLDDVEEVVRGIPSHSVTGIIVTGDLAFSGTAEEYEKAGKWLDQLAIRAGCLVTAVQVVPGNHDVYRKNICKSSAWMLDEIASKGESALESFLEEEQDREVLYGRFRPYRKFAEGYDCPLDGSGGIAGQKRFEIADGRFLRFVGLNSALGCGTKDVPGKLLLGARQWVLPRTRGEELVVLCHHPLHWFRDSDDALRYVQSRARLFISGHEHNPRLAVMPVEAGCDLLTIESGATTPPEETSTYTFTYNFLDFAWHSDTDGLQVTVNPRIWSGRGTRFEMNPSLPGADVPTRVLGCPNFRAVNSIAGDGMGGESVANEEQPCETGTPPLQQPLRQQEGGKDVADEFPLLLLRFFRDLTGAQRLAVLVKLGALPHDWIEPLNHSAERRVLDTLRASNRLKELESAIDEVRNSSAGAE